MASELPDPVSNILPSDLPVAEVLDAVVAASRGGTVVVTAPPGSGKTMLVPAAVLDDLPKNLKVVLMQPRRLAARAVAYQIARLRRVPLGGEVGYQVRFDSCVSRDTRLVVETTGIMLRRLLDDVALEGIGAVVLDEFHERTLEMDLVLGLLARIRQTLRPDLRIVVMSATLVAEPVARLLAPERSGGCPIVSAEGRRFPVEKHYLRRGEQRELLSLVVATVTEALRATRGHVLVFLPGVGEIMNCQQALAPLAERQGHSLLTLFGDLPPDQQDRVLADFGTRKIILSTNVAETSLTIPGVTAVIDSGQVRQMRVSPATGLPRLELIPISQASAEQRAGRAGGARLHSGRPPQRCFLRAARFRSSPRQPSGRPPQSPLHVCHAGTGRCGCTRSTAVVLLVTRCTALGPRRARWVLLPAARAAAVPWSARRCLRGPPAR